MCGFVGFFEPGGFVSSSSEDTLYQMRDKLIHRGPDDGGVWFDGEAGIGLTHRRLSIIDLTEAGHQPMISKTGRYVIVFNGEIYNHLDLRQRLEKREIVKWVGYSDTETLLASIEVLGVEQTLKETVGMFAFALWDRKTHTLILARDRMGEKPLYYGWQGRVLLFGSELKSLKIHPDFQNELNSEVLPLYMRHGYIPAPSSIWKGIRKLMPGTFVVFGSSDFGVIPISKSYWSLSEAIKVNQNNSFKGTEAQAIDELEILLSNSIKGQQLSDVPIGAFLSGGVDSSTIVSLMQAQSTKPIKTFTIGFNEEEFNESKHAKLISDHLGTDHHEMILTPKDSLDIIPNLSQIFDEPFGDSSAIPTLLVAKLAKQHVTVSLSGDAGDELFGGYERYSKFERWNNQVSLIPSVFRQPLSAAIRIAPLKFSNFGKRHQKLLAEILASKNPTKLYSLLTSHWLDGDNVVIDKTEANYWLNNNSFDKSLNDPLDYVMLADAMTYLPDDILVKVDRAAMAVSLETRVPMLDHRIVEWSLSLPQNLKTRGINAKWVLRKLLYKHVPEKLIERPKMGFGVPIGSWLRGPLKDWAEDLLDPNRMMQEGFFNVNPIQEKWKEHKLGINNWEYHLWDVLMFQSWLRTQIDE
jgi:asparagine synthase (glutamine-hydrolysing)